MIFDQSADDDSLQDDWDNVVITLRRDDDHSERSMRRAIPYSRSLYQQQLESFATPVVDLSGGANVYAVNVITALRGG